MNVTGLGKVTGWGLFEIKTLLFNGGSRPESCTNLYPHASIFINLYLRRSDRER